ncbi:MAG: hypothetical protein FWE69_08455 [Clostridiales bacterium]|nr:hypothetical protein [Clostridiales bacterium]
MYSSFPSELAAILPLFLLILGICLVAWGLAITDYVLRGLAILKLSAKQGVPNGWLGFIPIVNNYQLGALAGEIEFGKKKVKNTGVWLLVLPIAFGVVTAIGSFIIMVLPLTFRMTVLEQTPHFSPDMILAPMMSFTIGILIYTLLLVAAQVIVYLFRGLALHKIFARYADGQRPVFYVILSVFVPLAESILLFKQRKKPLLDEETA